MKRIALYFRVSTDDQTTEPQRIEIREYCARRGWENMSEYSDKISGAKFTRAGLDRLMADVRKGRVDAVVCVKLDRIGRSLPHMAQIIAEMDAHKVALIATSQGIDTSHENPAGRLQMHVLMAVAEFERSLIRERTKAGLAAARQRGSRLGRPALLLDADQERIISEHLGEYGKARIAELSLKLGCSIGKSHAILKARS